MTVLVLTTRDDGSSRRSGGWADRLVARFPELLTPHTETSRDAVEQRLSEHRHVLYFGHGELDALVIPKRFLRSRRALVDASNLPTAPGRIVIAVACWSGDGLGPAVTDGRSPVPVSAYIGWRDEVSWPTDWPDPIGDAVVEGVSALLDGGTVGECAAAIAAAFDEAHESYRTAASNGVPADRAALGKMCATYWKARMAVEGDLSARL